LFGGTLASHGRAGAFVVDRTKLRVEVGPADAALDDAPETLRAVADRLIEEATTSEKARRALLVLYRLFNESKQCVS